LRDDRLKLALELGPLKPVQRLAIINGLELLGLPFLPKSKQSTSRYTRLYSNSKVLTSWQDEEEIYKEMEVLFNDPKYQSILSMIEALRKIN
jgi:hypothetical protein